MAYKEKTDFELLELFYDNHFGKPFTELTEEEMNCLIGTYSFQLYAAGTRLKEAMNEIGRVIFKGRLN